MPDNKKKGKDTGEPPGPPRPPRNASPASSATRPGLQRTNTAVRVIPNVTPADFPVPPRDAPGASPGAPRLQDDLEDELELDLVDLVYWDDQYDRWSPAGYLPESGGGSGDSATGLGIDVTHAGTVSQGVSHFLVSIMDATIARTIHRLASVDAFETSVRDPRQSLTLMPF